MSQWKDHARTLSFGQRRKVKCCGSTPSAYLSNSQKGLGFHCFRCGRNDFEAHGRLSSADFIRMRQADEEEAARAFPEVVPLYGEGVPVSAHLWVLKAGITPERATDEYGFGWSEHSSRVVVPILHDGTPTGVWTARDTTPSRARPKYVMPKGSIGSSWYRLFPDRVAVVVEDVLSAIRVAEAGYGSLAVLGTSVGPTQAMLLADHPVVGWFDGDKAGRDGFVKLRKALGPYGIEPKRVQSERDPKDYNRDEIIKYIEDAT